MVAFVIVVLVLVLTTLLLSGHSYLTPPTVKQWLGDLSTSLRKTEPPPMSVDTRPIALRNITGELKRWGPLLKTLLIHTPVGYQLCKNILTTMPVIEGSWNVCLDPPFNLGAPCLVYSFGVGFDFSFEDTLAQYQCDIFSFDPSMNTSDHQRSARVAFFATGLGAVNSDAFVPRLNSYVKTKTTWKMRTLDTLRRQLGHEKRTIDVLKMDIESYEWAVIRQMLDKGTLTHVKQLILEWHVFEDAPPRHLLVDMISVVLDLRRKGFVDFTVRGHPFTDDWDHFNVQSDFGYLNTRFMK